MHLYIINSFCIEPKRDFGKFTCIFKSQIFFLKDFLIYKKNQLFLPGENYHKKFVHGSFMIFKGNLGRELLYFTFKSVMIICSSFNYNYGTTTLHSYDPDEMETLFLESLDCPFNATDIKTCIISNKM